MKKILFLFAASTVLFACDKEKNKASEVKSDEVTLHGGKVWSSVKLDKDSNPTSISLVLNDAALNSVPVGQPSDHMSPANNLIIPVSDQAGTPFKSIMVNWNSSGHEPDGVYDKPHFDFHFYTIAGNEIMNLLDTVKMNHNLPAATYVPGNYIAPGGGVPMMGLHWLDVTSPELTGQAQFTQTFIYGSYDSKVIFYEPMITLDFLKNNNNYERPIPQPSKFKTAGYYPTKMKVIKHDGVTEVVLDGLTYRQAS
jgi:hypothetical protein